MSSREQIEKFRQEIERQRLGPMPWDFSYLMLKNNLEVFTRFRNDCLAERKTHILDVGCGFKPWKKLFNRVDIEYIGVDCDGALSKPDFIAPANALPFSDNQFDALIYSEVLEHVCDLPGVLLELRRVAKSGALVFISSPFLFPEHGIPYDFQRLTKYFYEHEFAGDEIVEMKKSNSSVSTLLTLVNYVIESSPLKRFTVLKYPLYMMTNVLGVMADGFIELVFSKIGMRYKEYLYLMSLSNALIVRIKK